MFAGKKYSCSDSVHLSCHAEHMVQRNESNLQMEFQMLRTGQIFFPQLLLEQIF